MSTSLSQKTSHSTRGEVSTQPRASASANLVNNYVYSLNSAMNVHSANVSCDTHAAQRSSSQNNVKRSHSQKFEKLLSKFQRVFAVFTSCWEGPSPVKVFHPTTILNRWVQSFEDEGIAKLVYPAMVKGGECEIWMRCLYCTHNRIRCPPIT